MLYQIVKVAPVAWNLPRGAFFLYLGSVIVFVTPRRIVEEGWRVHFYLLPNGQVEHQYVGPGFAKHVAEKIDL